MALVNPSEIRKQGWVYKESAMLRQYRKRWLVLTPEKLFTFKHERKYDAPTEVRFPFRRPRKEGGGWRECRPRAAVRSQEVDLRQCGTVKSADDMTNRPFSFTVQVPERHFFLVATSDGERNEWVAAIGRATTESRRVRSYSEEVEYQEQQARLAAANKLQQAATAPKPPEGDDDFAPQRRGTAFS